MYFRPTISGNPKAKMPMIANGAWPKTTEVMLNNLSSAPLRMKFQEACKNAANKTARIINDSIIKYLIFFYLRLI